MNVKKHRPRKRYNTRSDELDRMIRELIDKAGGSPDSDLLEEIVVTALRVREDEIDRGDIKLLNSAMKELRYALKIFNAYRHVRKVAIFGSARTPKSSAHYKLAREFAWRIAQQGWMVITGAASGIMKAGNEGAGRAQSFGVNVRLPFEQRANPYIIDDPKLITFKYFFTRKLIFIKESDATVLFPGGFGTHDETFENLTLVQTGKANPRPLVCIDSARSGYWKGWRRFVKHHLADTGMIDQADLSLIHLTKSPKEAVEVITRFYRNYHSLRYIGDRLVLRMKRLLAPEHLKQINKNFKDIIGKGRIEQRQTHFKEEEEEPFSFGLPRLVFIFDRHHFARLHELIGEINKG